MRAMVDASGMGTRTEPHLDVLHGVREVSIAGFLLAQGFVEELLVLLLEREQPSLELVPPPRRVIVLVRSDTQALGLIGDSRLALGELSPEERHIVGRERGRGFNGGVELAEGRPDLLFLLRCCALCDSNERLAKVACGYARSRGCRAGRPFSRPSSSPCLLPTSRVAPSWPRQATAVSRSARFIAKIEHSDAPSAPQSRRRARRSAP